MYAPIERHTNFVILSAEYQANSSATWSKRKNLIVFWVRDIRTASELSKLTRSQRQLFTPPAPAFGRPAIPALV